MGQSCDSQPNPTQGYRGDRLLHHVQGHGRCKGELVVEREDIALAGLDVMRPENLHIQAICRVRLLQEGRPEKSGLGILEQMVRGPYAPYGFTGISDPAS